MGPWHSRTLAARWYTKDGGCQHSILILGMLTVPPPPLELTSSVLLGILWETTQNELWRPYIKEQLLSFSGCFQDKGNTWHFQATLWADLVNSLHTKESSGAAELKARWRRMHACVCDLVHLPASDWRVQGCSEIRIWMVGYHGGSARQRFQNGCCLRTSPFHSHCLISRGRGPNPQARGHKAFTFYCWKTNFCQCLLLVVWGVMGLFLVSGFPLTNYKLFKERNYLFYDGWYTVALHKYSQNRWVSGFSRQEHKLQKSCQDVSIPSHFPCVRLRKTGCCSQETLAPGINQFLLRGCPTKIGLFVLNNKKKKKNAAFFFF